MVTTIENGTQIIDEEAQNALRSPALPVFYKCQMANGGSCIKKYKPEYAALLMKRTGLHFERI